MAYVPLDPAALVPGILGTTEYYQDIADNADEVYQDYAPTIAEGLLDVQVTSGSFVTVAHWVMPYNVDDSDIITRFRWRVSGGATAEAQVTIGATTTAATSTTSATTTNGNRTATPVYAAHPTECYLEVRISSGSGTVFVDGLLCYRVPGAPAAGALTSGYARTDGQWYATDEPISSERVARLINAPRLIARDRGACLVCAMDDSQAAGTRAKWSTTASTWTQVARFVLLPYDTVTRDYRVSVRLRSTSTPNPSALVGIGAQQVQLDGTTDGWYHGTLTLPPAMLMGTVSIKLDGSGGYAILDTLQILRERA
jgi:hypothetical protein